MADTPTCTAVTRAGSPCCLPPAGNDGLCFFHSNDPQIAKLRQVGRSAGGRATRRIRQLTALKGLKGPRDMLKRIEELYIDLTELHVSPKTVAAACKLLREARECYELILLEERLRDALRQLGQPELPELRVAREDEPDANVDAPDENGP